jgi:AhpD family alkylhydroperoxidase
MSVSQLQRVYPYDVDQKVAQSLIATSGYAHKNGLEYELITLVELRVSQINGCAFCLNMHASDLRKANYPQRKMDLLPAWHEVDDFTDRERAALAWAEAVTRLTHSEVSDEQYEAARSEFNDQELVSLTMAIIAINSWNRMNIAFRVPPAD